MNPKPLSQARDEDARNITEALKRAGQRARTIAAQTQTDIIVVRDGKLVRETPISQKNR
jgi:hypothetical protein